MKRTALLAIPLSAALMAGACGDRAEQRIDTAEQRIDGTVGTTGSSPADEPLDDSRINSAVQTKVYASEGLSSRNVEVLTMNGEVTLTGRVENEAIKQNALKVASEAEGVTRVVDQLVIDPEWRAKAEAAEAAEDAADDARDELEKKN